MDIEFVQADPSVQGAAFLALFEQGVEDAGHPARVMATLSSCSLLRSPAAAASSAWAARAANWRASTLAATPRN